MSRNRRRGSNPIPIGRFVPWFAAVFIFTTFALTMVYMKNTLHVFGEQQRQVERQIDEMRREIKTVESQVIEWSSRAVLERRLAEGFISLVPIPNEKIVRLHHTPVVPVLASDIRPASNP
jgi:hypothetical protein